MVFKSPFEVDDNGKGTYWAERSPTQGFKKDTRNIECMQDLRGRANLYAMDPMCCTTWKGQNST